MQQVADWLEKLGLGQYAQRFAENGIDFSVLGYLTDQDLEKIGVLLGHRRKMLASQLLAPPASRRSDDRKRAGGGGVEPDCGTRLFALGTAGCLLARLGARRRW
jgi:hypothetical protein